MSARKAELSAGKPAIFWLNVMAETAETMDDAPYWHEYKWVMKPARWACDRGIDLEPGALSAR